MTEEQLAELKKSLEEIVKTGRGVGSEATPASPSDKNKQPEAGSGYVWKADEAATLIADVANLSKAVDELSKAFKDAPWMKGKDDGDEDDVKKAEAVAKAAETYETVDALKSSVEAILDRVEKCEVTLARGVRKSIPGQDGGGAAAPAGFDGLVQHLMTHGSARLS